MLLLRLREIAIFEVAEHDIHHADIGKIPGVAGGDDGHRLIRIWILIEVAIGEQSAVMIGVILPILLILRTALIGSDTAVGKHRITLIHVCSEIIVGGKRVVLLQAAFRFAREETLASGEEHREHERKQERALADSVWMYVDILHFFRILERDIGAQREGAVIRIRP